MPKESLLTRIVDIAFIIKAGLFVFTSIFLIVFIPVLLLFRDLQVNYVLMIIVFGCLLLIPIVITYFFVVETMRKEIGIGTIIVSILAKWFLLSMTLGLLTVDLIREFVYLGSNDGPFSMLTMVSFIIILILLIQMYNCYSLTKCLQINIVIVSVAANIININFAIGSMTLFLLSVSLISVINASVMFLFRRKN